MFFDVKIMIPQKKICVMIWVIVAKAKISHNCSSELKENADFKYNNKYIYTNNKYI